MMSRVPGVVAPTVEHRLSEPTVNIEVKLDAARRYGLAPGDVRRDATTMVLAPCAASQRAVSKPKPAMPPITR